ncbi:homeobox protein Nkx-2.3-like [Kryptolebias marmoratus]|uniref:homeobox protein Nkx-2.3-like n=1 Tax=Kryptolebias marmoratus TaxID=37003 RepID=UPI0007F91562|nr:homeobox protein Nkx-2.3-like [Kryptolebias marmoratus]
MLLGGLHFLDAAELELDDMMLQSPLTSTPFSVKDILKLEQQQQQQQSGSLELTHRGHSQQHLARSPPQHFQSPPSCMLAGPRDSPSFSDGEDNLGYLSALAVRDEERGDTSLSPNMYVHPGLQGAKLEGPELEEPESTPPPPRRVAVPVLVRDGKPCLGSAQSYPPAAPYSSNPYSYNGYPTYSYSSPAYNSSYSCPALPPASTPSAFINMNLGTMSGLGGSPQTQTHQGTAVTSCQGSLQGIRAW